MVREADGYQAHLVSPEYGLRRLVDEAIGMVHDPVSMCVRRVHQVLLDAARCAPPPPGGSCAVSHQRTPAAVLRLTAVAAAQSCRKLPVHRCGFGGASCTLLHHS